MGRAIRFPESDVPPTGRATQGVRGVQLRKGDGVVGLVVVKRDASLCTVTELGYAKRTPIADYPAQKRGGLGTITLDVSAKTGLLVSGKEVVPGDELMVITADGVITRVRADDIPEQGRATQGRQLLKPTGGDRIVEVARAALEGDDERASRQPRDATPAGAAAGPDQLDLMG
jgi:DNA gyrase subunit A